MKFNLDNEVDRINYKERSNKLLFKRSNVELKEVRLTRTAKQNRAMHLLFTFIATELNELGLEFNYTGLKGSNMSTRYTPHLVKEFFWRPIQVALFDIESTTKIDTKQMNEITDVISKFFAERGVVLEFPSIDQLIN